MKTWKVLTSILLLSAAFCCSGQINRHLEITVGGDHTLIPFGLDYLHEYYGWESVRYQQVCDKQFFIGRFIDGFIIREIEFRRATVGHAIYTTLPEVEIRLSTSPRGVDNLSAVFAENIGEDETIVYPQGSLDFYDQTRIVLEEPFHYYSSRGHLLIEIRNFKTNGLPLWEPYVVGPLDSRDRLGDRISRCYATYANAAVADVVDTQALWMGLWGTVIPPEGKLQARLIAGGVEFTWTGAPYFRLQRATRLTPPNWANVPGTGGGSNYVETTLGTAAFYRINSNP